MNSYIECKSTLFVTDRNIPLNIQNALSLILYFEKVHSKKNKQEINIFCTKYTGKSKYITHKYSENPILLF